MKGSLSGDSELILKLFIFQKILSQQSFLIL